MSLLVDPRAGSGTLLPLLKARQLPVQLAKLSFADFAFLGHGPDGEPIPVGIERKALNDFLTSMYDGRLPGHQLPGMLACYQDIWVVIEGLWREDETTGRVVVPCFAKQNAGKKKGKITWRDLETGKAHGVMAGELEGMCLTLEMKGGVRIRFTKNQRATARFVSRLYRWWTVKQYDEHRSHLKFHTPGADRALLTKPTLCREVASRLPGVGWVKSGAVADRFGSVAGMVNAGEQEWTEITGIGKTMAKRIVEALHVPGWTG